MILTFALGLASFWFSHNLKITENMEVVNATIVTIVPMPRFTESFRACGFGYINIKFQAKESKRQKEI